MNCLCDDLTIDFCPVHDDHFSHVGIRRLRTAALKLTADLAAARALIARQARALAAGPEALREYRFANYEDAARDVEEAQRRVLDEE